MSEDLVCPDCGHSVAFHGYYDICEAPIELTTKKIYQRCGCNKTTYTMIKELQAKLDIAVDLIKRLSEWDMIWLGAGQPSLVSDGRYWKREIDETLKKLEK